MPSDTPIPPALTEAEWRESEIESRNGRFRTSLEIDHKGRIFAYAEAPEGEEDKSVLLNQSYDYATVRKVAALANGALPDDYPGKLTRADAEWCRLLAGNHTVDFGELEVWAESMHQKLTSILPPEDPDAE